VDNVRGVTFLCDKNADTGALLLPSNFFSDKTVVLALLVPARRALDHFDDNSYYFPGWKSVATVRAIMDRKIQENTVISLPLHSYLRSTVCGGNVASVPEPAGPEENGDGGEREEKDEQEESVLGPRSLLEGSLRAFYVRHNMLDRVDDVPLIVEDFMERNSESVDAAKTAINLALRDTYGFEMDV
jgi:hypothetical protein